MCLVIVPANLLPNCAEAAALCSGFWTDLSNICATCHPLLLTHLLNEISWQLQADPLARACSLLLCPTLIVSELQSPNDGQCEKE